MPKRFPWIVSAIALMVCLMVLPSVMVAQYGQSTGGIFGKVVDEQGGVLPGVSVIVKGPGAPTTVYTDARGEFRVTNIDPGNYTLTVSLQGFSTVNRENVVVQVGKNTELTIPMKLSAVAATVTVTGEAPILETKRVSTGAQISQAELASIPTARDPWVVLQSAPGVQVDRVNVAGSESGQQSNFGSHGSTGRHVHGGRRQPDRHVGSGRVGGLLRLRLVPGDAGHHGRQRRVNRGLGDALEHGDQARDQRDPRQRASLRGRSSLPIDQPSLRCVGVGRSPRATTSTRSRTRARKWAARWSRTRCGCGAPTVTTRSTW